MPRKPTTPSVKPATPAPVRGKATQKAAAAAARQNQREEFERQRPQLWQAIFGKALRIELARRTEEVFLDNDFPNGVSEDWWFEDFGVNVLAGEFKSPELGGTWVSEKKLHASDVQRLNADLDKGWELLQEFIALVEEKERVARERAEKIRKAIEKLDPDERKLLNVHMLV